MKRKQLTLGEGLYVPPELGQISLGPKPIGPVTILQSEIASASPTSLTAPAGATFMVAFSVAAGTGGDSPADAVTWNSTETLTELAGARANGSGWECCGAWYLANPGIATANITYSGHSGNHRLLVYWLSKVNTLDPIRDVGVTNIIDVGFIDVTGVASALTDLTLSSGAVSTATSMTAGLGMTRDLHSVGGGGAFGGGYELGVAGDASVRWTAGVGGRLAGNLISIKAG